MSGRDYVTVWGQPVCVSISSPSGQQSDSSALILASYNSLIIVRLSTMNFPRPAHPLTRRISPRDSHESSISAAVDQTLWQAPRRSPADLIDPPTYTPPYLRAHHGEARCHLMEGLFVYQTDPQLCPRWLQGRSHKAVKAGRTGGKSFHSGDY